MSPTPVYDLLASVLPKMLPSFLGNNPALIKWTPGQTPFSTGTSVVVTGALYLTTVLGGRAVMNKHGIKPLKLKWPFVIHNALLAVSSFLLLAAYLEEILPFWYKNGFYAAICAPSSWTARMETLYVINYMFKYWELIDTVFLMVKGKPLPFLHVYHHSATALLCFSQLLGKSSVSWVVITLNLAIHSVMYSYYGLSTLGIRCPWKVWLTSAQITQFVIDLGVVYFAAYHHLNGYWSLGLPHAAGHGQCAAKPHAAISGVVILSSYLLLFIQFYRKTYAKTKSQGSVRSAASGEKQPLLGNAKPKTSPRLAATGLSAMRQRPSTPRLEHAVDN